MRNFIKYTILTASILLAQSITTNAQVEVLADNSVKITPHTTHKTDLTTTTPAINTFLTYNSANTSHWARKIELGGTTNNRYALDFLIHGTSNQEFGINNNMYGTSIQKTGMFNAMAGTTNTEYGIWNSLNSYNNSSSSFQKNGIYNTVYENDAKYSRGIRNFVNGGANSLQTYGIENMVYVTGNGDSYGSSNYISLTAATTSGHIRGISSRIVGTGTPSTAYGIYSSIDANINGYAGYLFGDLYVYGSITEASDREIKEDIKDINNSLEDLKKLKPKTYKINTKLTDTERRNYGFIAQDVMEVFPDLVKSVEQPGVERAIVVQEEKTIKDENGVNIIIPEEIRVEQEMDGKPLLSINYNGIIPIVVGALQEQQVQIDALAGNTKSNVLTEDFDDRIQYLEKELLKTTEELAQTNDNYDNLLGHIETLLKCVDCDGLRKSGSTGQIQFEDSFRLYPNPAKGSITIESLNQYASGYQIMITDHAGRRMLDHELTDALTPVDVSMLSTGLYNVSIILDDDVIATESLMIVNR